MLTVDLIVQHAAQLVTCAGGTHKRGAELRDVGVIRDGALAVRDGQIVAVGASSSIAAHYTAPSVIDASGCVVCPSFIDPHTHLVYAGDRLDEFEMRIQGAAYLDILKAGGGILHTVRATRAAPEAELVELARARLDAMLTLGTTTVEIKTGYGLDTQTEIKMLRVIDTLARTHPVEIVPTFLAAHAIPPEYASHPDAYLDLVIDEMLPLAAAWYQASIFLTRKTPFYVDIFCEDGTFSVGHLRRLFDAARAHGMQLKAHVDEFVNLGGVSAAVEAHAASVDHLDHTSPREIALLGRSSTAAVVIPTVNFNLGSAHFAPARALIDAGAVLALTTDVNPGSAPCLSMPMVMAIACRYQRLLPAEVLNASTLNAAYAIGLGEYIGSLEVGKQADFLILDAHDYRQLAYEFGANRVRHVFKKGQQLR